MRLTNAPKGAWPDLRRSRVLGMTLPDTAQPPLAATTRNTDRPVPGILPAVCARCHDKLRHHVRPALISLCPVMESNMIWSMTDRPRVTVLGSLNMDISVTVPRLPEPGATVLGSAARFTPGGKGANQAVAAARLGADVLAAAKNAPADVLVICAEIPVPAIKAALTKTNTCILNLAPAPPEPDAAAIVAGGVDWLVVNETEAGAVLGRPVRGLAEAGEAAAALLAAGARHAVVTAGAHGAGLAGPEGTGTVSAFRVDAVDTVGAGDTFVGALAVALAAGIPAAEAVHAASAAGATAATRPGAQAGMPRPADVLATTGVSWPTG